MTYLRGFGKKEPGGKRKHFYQELIVSATSFNTVPDMIITFTTTAVQLFNKSGSGVIEYSFDGYNKDGELDGASTFTRLLTLQGKIASPIWFRISTGSATVAVQAW